MLQPYNSVCVCVRACVRACVIINLLSIANLYGALDLVDRKTCV